LRNKRHYSDINSARDTVFRSRHHPRQPRSLQCEMHGTFHGIIRQRRPGL